MKRSKKFIFVPFCFFAQGIRAEGIVKKYPSVITPIAELLIREEINIIQMPCPEIEYEGIKRKPAIKQKYNTKEYREICRRYAEEIISFAKKLKGNNYQVLFMLGLENSPSCAVDYLFERGRKLKGSGVFIEELKNEMEREKIFIPLIGINIYGIKKTTEEIEQAVSKSKGIQKSLLDSAK
ncbi:MAG: hypothetical protein COX90_01920 [Candidatus Nealsonbacteria bacterium CG_4_10_14_0_2_um_filter_38_17]|uniref:Uncharacterized protein n=2 Tax=Candidatus Nealsoniibacteriota TaxID=1817911 RepID=A0A2M7UYF1_9BACT|nr:MAG: hypothetical protein COX36_03600 [Candidatus Nealsonbacteria bacterium CG23_combo_of_CG06-09_8_20_14_all_38_19]PIZ88979.1 MAG: hypothetical protein COX90_01920 [Candidatus Nealsonbacteria bacterium CG_4_10_14_0_2_um_filter_38_17]